MSIAALLIILIDDKTLRTAERRKESLKKSVEISASSSSIDFVGNLTHVM